MANTTKADLIDIVANKEGITKIDAKRIVETFLDAIKNSVNEGSNVMLVGFGTWTKTERAARKGRNPKTGEEINIEAKTIVKHKVKF